MSISFFKKLPWPRLIKFAIVGGSAFAIDFGIYYILTRFGHIHYIVSRIISIGLAMFWNFLLNRNWTFQAKTGKVRQQASRFTIVMTLTSVLNLLLMRVGVSVFHQNDLLVLVIVSALIMLINFFAHQLWSYKPDAAPTVKVVRKR